MKGVPGPQDAVRSRGLEFCLSDFLGPRQQGKGVDHLDVTWDLEWRESLRNESVQVTLVMGAERNHDRDPVALADTFMAQCRGESLPTGSKFEEGQAVSSPPGKPLKPTQR